MKRLLHIIAIALIICLVPASIVKGQNKKSEQKIKVVIDDGSGTKVVLDTLIKDGTLNDSLKLRDGKMIFIGHAGDAADINSDNTTENVSVTVSSDGNKSKTVTKTITVTSSDPDKMSGETDGDQFFVYSDSRNPDRRENMHYKIMRHNSRRGEIEHEKTIYIDSDSTASENGSSSAEKTKYIIAKNGMVITIESNDEEKAKELINVIENNLGAKGDNSTKKESIIRDSKKPVKK
jgi:hypothetical protein